MNSQEEIKIIHTTGRNNCGGRCIIHAHVRNGKIEKLATDTKDPSGGLIITRHFWGRTGFAIP